MDPTEKRPSDADTARELAGVKAEPLLPAEKWLIGVSLGLGLLLLGALLTISKVWFPIGP
jgi:hypothetical protein